MTRIERRWLIAAITLAVVVRVVLLGAVAAVRQDRSAFLAPDSRTYLRLGESLALNHSYAIDDRPELFRLPGFPALIAVGAWMGSPVPATLGLHVVLGAITTWICFLAGRIAGGPRTGVLAAVLYAVEPGQWAWSALMLTETLMATIVAGVLLAGMLYLRRPTLLLLLCAVALAVFAAYTRFVAYALPFAVVTALVWLSRRRSQAEAGRPARHVIAGLAAAAVLLGIWHVRNGLVSGFWGFSTQLSRAIYYSAGGSVAAARDGASIGDAHQALLADMKREFGSDAVETDDVLRERGLALIASRPVAFVAAHTTGIATVLVHPGTGAFRRLFQPVVDSPDSDSATQAIIMRRWRDARDQLRARDLWYWSLTILLFTINLGYLFLFARGVVRGRGFPPVLFVSAVVAYLLLVSGGPSADSRRRAPLVPAICVVAAWGLGGDAKGQRLYKVAR